MDALSKIWGWVAAINKWHDQGTWHLLMDDPDDSSKVKLACGRKVAHGGVFPEYRVTGAKCRKCEAIARRH